MPRLVVFFLLLSSVCFLASSSSSGVADRVDSIIASNHAVVFSKSYCPHCRAAKGLLTSLTDSVHITELDLDSEGSEIQQYLLQKTGQRTVPNIFIGQKHIGGNDRVQQLHREGKLTGLLSNGVTGDEL